MLFTINYLSAHAFTGLLNDFLDFEQDKALQPSKASAKGILMKKDIQIGIFWTGLIFVLTLFFVPFLTSLLLLLGLAIAQTYNFGLKNTPFSFVPFSVGFIFMFIVPYITKYGFSLFEFPFRFVVSGLILTISIHIVNDLKDVVVDSYIQSNSLIQYLGEKMSYTLLFILCLIFLIVNASILLIVFSFLPSLILIIWASPIGFASRLKFEYLYFIISVSFIFEICVLPIN